MTGETTRVLLTPTFLIATAGAFTGVSEQGNTNSGPMIDRFLASVRLRSGYPWCAAFVHYAGYWSHYDHVTQQSHWPLPNTASCWELGEYARMKGVLEVAPEIGDVFLVFNRRLGRFAHTGVVVKRMITTTLPDGTPEYDCVTIEGNTSEDGSREGTIVARRRRKLAPARGDRFIRWARLDTRAEDAEDPRAGGNAAA